MATINRDQRDLLLIFDFDGVVADSEVISNAILAQTVTELGVPTTLQDAYARYMGKRFSEVVAEIEAVTGRRLPDSFRQALQQRTLDAFRKELRPVEGALDYVAAFAQLPKCIASSSSPDRLALCLEVLKLHEAFAPHIYSASMVSRGKPAPDIFLHAAEQLGVAPSRCLVIEDSASGIAAALAAGMTVIGLLAASHIQAGYRERLEAAGAHYVVDSFADAKVATDLILGAWAPA